MNWPCAKEWDKSWCKNYTMPYTNPFSTWASREQKKRLMLEAEQNQKQTKATNDNDSKENSKQKDRCEEENINKLLRKPATEKKTKRLRRSKKRLRMKVLSAEYKSGVPDMI
jgi:hypothetical protein